MQRRTFFYRSTLGLTGLLAGQSVFAKSILTTREIQSIAPVQSIILGKIATKIGILRPEIETAGWESALAGASNMLREIRCTYQLVDSQDDLHPFEVLILPDMIQFTEAITTKIEAYLHQGGSLLASHRSGTTPEGTSFASPAFGVTLLGKAPFSPDFINPLAEAIARHTGNQDLLMYKRGMEVLPTNAQVLAHAGVLDFPSASGSQFLGSYPAITQHNRVIYFVHPIFTNYAHSSPRWCRQLVTNALEMLHSSSVASKSMPVDWV